MHKTHNTVRRLLAVLALAAGATLGAQAEAAVPGIAGGAPTDAAVTFNLTASADYISQPDGAMIYSWGYGCTTTPTAYLPASVPGNCPLMQIPGPTMVVTEGQQVTVNLTNSLPTPAGNTSIVFPGFQVATSGGVGGITTQEAAPGGTVSYTFTAAKPGTYAYYSGSQADLQVEMGLYGALIVVPKAGAPAIANCTPIGGKLGGQVDYRLAPAAYDHPETCYDREYLFQFTEMDSNIHKDAEAQVTALAGCVSTSTAPCAPITVKTEPYHPNYFLINGRSMPDDMDTPFSPAYPHQPYNGNPHMHPGELVLMRVIGQGHWQHPFHFHGNHARIIAQDANLLLSASDPLAVGGVLPRLAGPLKFTIATVSGQTEDGIFTWTGKGLNWDVYGHHANDGSVCIPDANGFYTAASGAPANAPNYGEWCADHDKPIPVTPPDPNIMTNGLWYAGTPYLGLNPPSGGFTSTPLPPGTALQNTTGGYAYMWHSHNEREITTNDVFPGGMMMMLVIDPPGAPIDESL